MGRVNGDWALLWPHKSVIWGCQGSPHPSHFLFGRGVVSTSNYVQWLDLPQSHISDSQGFRTPISAALGVSAAHPRVHSVLAQKNDLQLGSE